ncbi:MAG TPA: GDSL-type esterase/lipase family protein [Segetibacter sp.]
MQWYKDDVEAVIQERLTCPYEPKTIFYGSSSIRLWTTLYEDFEEYKPVNLGFGGSTLAACVWFFNTIVAPLKNPKTFVLYAGDNDLGDGRHPEEVLMFFREFMVKLREFYPDIPFYFVSIKPSISRLQIMAEIVHTNKLIEAEIYNRNGNDYYVNVFDRMIDNSGKPIASLFEDDGLHLNKNGYSVWKQVILNDCLLKQKLH